MTPTLVLTRPEAQSRAMAAEFADSARVVNAPVMHISGAGARVDLSGYGGVILTSANAVDFAPALDGIRVYCVGNRTADAARARGAEIVLVAQDADALVRECESPGPLIHLRGEHARGDVAKRLSLAGIETHEAVIYRQQARPLSKEARALIEGEARVILPLFSPRSARLVGEQVERVGPQVAAIAMSPAVASAWEAATGRSAEVCAEPTGQEMRARISAKLRG